MFLKEFLKAPEAFLIWNGRSSENDGFLKGASGVATHGSLEGFSSNDVLLILLAGVPWRHD
jgi:hypothetical protein